MKTYEDDYIKEIFKWKMKKRKKEKYVKITDEFKFSNISFLNPIYLKNLKKKLPFYDASIVLFR